MSVLVGVVSQKVLTIFYLTVQCFSVVSVESLKWLGISTALQIGGPKHLIRFKSLVNGSRKIGEKLVVIWFANVWVVW